MGGAQGTATFSEYVHIHKKTLMRRAQVLESILFIFVLPWTPLMYIVPFVYRLSHLFALFVESTAFVIIFGQINQVLSRRFTWIAYIYNKLDSYFLTPILVSCITVRQFGRRLVEPFVHTASSALRALSLLKNAFMALPVMKFVNQQCLENLKSTLGMLVKVAMKARSAVGSLPSLCRSIRMSASAYTSPVRGIGYLLRSLRVFLSKLPTHPGMLLGVLQGRDKLSSDRELRKRRLQRRAGGVIRSDSIGLSQPDSDNAAQGERSAAGPQ